MVEKFSKQKHFGIKIIKQALAPMNKGTLRIILRTDEGVQEAVEMDTDYHLVEPIFEMVANDAGFIKAMNKEKREKAVDI